jgi:sugar fermentation stimulation protein A
LKFPSLIPATFIKRDNRFRADVKLDTGRVTAVYVPTTGRLTGILRPECRVWLERVNDPQRKTGFNLVLSELEQGGFCCVNASLANQLFAEAVAGGRLPAFPYTKIEGEVALGHSRLDFRLSSAQDVCWVEVKSVTFVEDGLGKFPDAPTARGRRHLETLAQLASGDDRASAVFIAQRGDAQRFAPYAAIDPAFAETLCKVNHAGVEVHAYRCAVSLEGIEIVGEIPVDLTGK